MRIHRIAIALIAILAAQPSIAIGGTNKYWKNSVFGGNWSGGNNWSNISAAGADNGGAPITDDLVYIAPTDGVARGVAYDVTEEVFLLLIDLTGPGTGSTNFFMSGNTLFTNYLTIGFNGGATSFQSAGTVDAFQEMTVGGQAGSNGLYNLSGTGQLSVTNDLFIARYASSSGTFNLSGTGTLSADRMFVGFDSNNGTFNQTGGTNSIANALYIGTNPGSAGAYTISGGTLSVNGSMYVGLSGVGTLTVQGTGIVSTNDLSIYGSSNVNLNGGTLNTGTLAIVGSTFNFPSGTLHITGQQAIDSTLLGKVFGSTQTISSGKNFVAAGTATLTQSFVLDGGSFSVGQLANASLLDRRRGTLTLTNQAVTIGSNGLFGSTFDVPSDTEVNVALGITNQGLVTGDGRIGGTFANAAGGELRAEPGRSLTLTGPSNTNAGRINLLGGVLEFTQDLSNNAGALISGDGSLITGAGLTNNGVMNFGGTANILGDVTNASGGRIISGGGGATIFFDDVANQGEIRTSTNALTVFYGTVSGAGTFTGTGTVNMEGDLTPGNSPAAVQFAGNLALGPATTLTIELGGTTLGSQFDQINVNANLSIDGVLQILLINGFTPHANDAFNILDWGSRSGTFSALQLSTLAGGLVWNTSQLYTAGVLSVAMAGVPGDYNNNGVV